METQRNRAARKFHCFPGGKGESLSISKHYRIVLVDDHAMFRRGIKRIIDEGPNLKVVGEAGDGYEVLDLLKEIFPDLVILDISMPKCGGMEASREIKRIYPGLKVMILTMHRGEEYMQRALSIGVDGYLLKEAAADELIEAIFTLREGETYFSAMRSKCDPSELLVRTAPGREIAW
jgi:DNA-binding NarL/FixJ family response regulator